MRDVRPVFPWLLVVLVLCGLPGCGFPQRPNLGGSTSTANGALPSGTIVAFAGNEIPAGWTLCDGRATPTGLATPDLRGRVVLGANPGPEAGQVGGSETHTHTAAADTVSGGTVGVDRDNDAFVPTGSHRHEVNVAAADHLPPHVRLVYIMKD